MNGKGWAERLEDQVAKLEASCESLDASINTLKTQVEVLAKEVSYLKILVFGFAALILTGFVTALVAGVFKGTTP